jgi:hypothetical protein
MEVVHCIIYIVHIQNVKNNMKKVTDFSQVQRTIENKEDFYQEINGKKYKLNFILVLQMKLIDILSMIKEGTLFYTTEF